MLLNELSLSAYLLRMALTEMRNRDWSVQEFGVCIVWVHVNEDVLGRHKLKYSVTITLLTKEKAYSRLQIKAIKPNLMKILREKIQIFHLEWKEIERNSFIIPSDVLK